MSQNPYARFGLVPQEQRVEEPAPQPQQVNDPNDPRPYAGPADQPNRGRVVTVNSLDELRQTGGLSDEEIEQQLQAAGYPETPRQNVSFQAGDGTTYKLKDNRGWFSQWKSGDAEIPGVGETADNAARGVAGGASGFKDSLADLAATPLGGNDLSERNRDEFDTEDSLVSEAARGITQFGLGFVTGSQLLRGVGWAAGTGGKLMQTGRAFTGGATADFIAFSEHEDRLSNVIQSSPSLANPITEFLAAGEDDGVVEGRLKNVLEGGAMGIAGDILFASLRGFRKAKAVQKAEGDEAAQKVLDETAEEVERLSSKIPTRDDIQKRAKSLFEKAGHEKAADEHYWITAERQLLQEARERAARDADVRAGGQRAGLPEEGPTGRSGGFKLSPEQKSEFATRMENGESVYEAGEHLWNTARAETPEEAMRTLDNIADVMPDEILKVRGGKQTYREIEEGAAWLGRDPQKLVASLARDAEHQATLTKRFVAGKNMMHELSNRLVNQARLVQSSTDDADMVKYLQMQDTLASLQRSLLGIRTGSARTTGAGNIVTGPRLVEDDMLRGASPEKIEELLSGSGRSRKQIREHAQRMAALNDPGAVSKFLREFSLKDAATGLMEAHNKIWINTMLWGTGTHTVTTLMSSIRTLWSPASRGMGAAVTGDMRTVRESLSMYAGFAQFLGDATRGFGRAMRTGENVVDPVFRFSDDRKMHSILPKSTTDFKALVEQTGQALRGQNPDGPFDSHFLNVMNVGLSYLDSAVGMSGRILTAYDEFFKQLNYRASVRAKAVSAATERGLEGEQLTQFVRQQFDNAFDAQGRGVDESALQFGRESTWSSQLGKDTIGGKVRDIAVAHPTARLFIPFARVSVNLFRDAFDHTPGLAMSAKRNRQNLADPRHRADVLGKQMGGAILVGSAMTLWRDGMVTGNGPANPEARKQWLAAGNQPYSFRFPDGDDGYRYISYQRYDPIATFLGMVADTSELLTESEDGAGEDVLMAFMESFANNVTNKTYMRGLTEGMDALMNPDRSGERFLRSRIASYVPNPLRDFGTGSDMKEARRLLDGARAKIPGLSDTLDPRRNVLGEPMTLSFGGNVGRALGMPYSHVESDPVMEELISLNAGFGHPPQTLGNVDLTEIRMPNGRTAYDRWVELQSEIKPGGRTLRETLGKTIKSRAYQSLPDAAATGEDVESLRVAPVRRVLQAYRGAAMSQLRQESPEVNQALQEDVQASRTIQRYGKEEAVSRLRLGGIVIE